MVSETDDRGAPDHFPICRTCARSTTLRSLSRERLLSVANELSWLAFSSQLNLDESSNNALSHDDCRRLNAHRSVRFMNRPQSFAIWITGLPASGKSTIVSALQPQLEGLGLAVEGLESDKVRRGIKPITT